jgi:hypothetical protein
MNARVNWVYIIPSNAKTLYTYSNVIAAASLFSVPRAEWIRIELPMIINTCAVSVILKDLHKKWVLKCVGFTRLMPAAIDLLVQTILPIK